MTVVGGTISHRLVDRALDLTQTPIVPEVAIDFPAFEAEYSF